MLTCFDEAGNPEFFTRNYAPFNIINELQNNSIHLKMVDVKAQLELGWEIIKGLRYEFMGAVRYVKFYTKILNIRKQKPYLYYPMVVFITGPKIS